MKFRIDLVEKEGNEDIFEEEILKTVPLYVDPAHIVAAYPTGDKEYINIFFGDWMLIKYSDEVWRELQTMLT
jgi:hypothetical protein